MNTNKRTINVCNGNPLCWITADELTDEEVQLCLQIVDGWDHFDYVLEAHQTAGMEADNDREWLQIFADYLTAHDPEFADGVVFY